MAYLPIAEHGLIGNMHTAALVGTDGTMDWLCYPRFDSPSVFASILDDRRGGRFRIASADDSAATKQLYWPDTNILITRFVTGSGLGEVADFMPLVFFLSPTDPRFISTLDAIRQPPEAGGLTRHCLAYRYLPQEGVDGLGGQEGTFNMCSFWLAEALTRAGRTDRGRLEAARRVFEEMLGYANHLGLFAEETGLRGKALGNYPQAFTHLALISAAVNLDRALSPDEFDWPGLPAGSGWKAARKPQKE